MKIDNVDKINHNLSRLLGGEEVLSLSDHRKFNFKSYSTT